MELCLNTLNTPGYCGNSVHFFPNAVHREVRDGLSRARQGDQKAAIERYDAALELCPQHKAATDNLIPGDVEKKTSERDQNTVDMRIS